MLTLVKGLALGVAAGAILSLLPFEQSAAREEPSRACASPEQMRTVLEQGHDEEVAGLGLGADGNLFQLYVSKEGGWSLVRITPGGQACLMAVGKEWQSARPLVGQVS